MSFSKGLISAVFLPLASSVAFAAPTAVANLAEKLQEFNKNPKAFMESKPQKYNPETGTPIQFIPFDLLDPNLKEIPNNVLPFSSKAINEKEKTFIDEKHHLLQQQQLAGKALIEDNDRPENLLDEPEKMLRTLEEMEQANLKSASLDESPWSGYYWPISKGVLAFRYSDPYFPNSPNWFKNVNYLQNPFIRDVYKSVDVRSPAEKYDLLVGDSNFSLTKAMIQHGQSFFKNSGAVKSWMGICHGWSAASYSVKRPQHGIQLRSPDGKNLITFYPDDIKALASLLYANAAPQSKFLGKFCGKKDPEMDENGRVIDQNCFDTNPATWHMVVTNRLGLEKKSFVLNVNNDDEIWNQPVYSYSYSYFNPQTGDPKDTLEEAKVSRRAYKADKFKKYRSADATHFVGIAMKLTYVVETVPTARWKNDSGNDYKVAVDYLYDLELDQAGKIIGGEWRKNKHPDFLWTSAADARANSVADRLLDDKGSPRTGLWDRNQPVPAAWREVAPVASQKRQPMARIVEALVEFARE